MLLSLRTSVHALAALALLPIAFTFGCSGASSSSSGGGGSNPPCTSGCSPNTTGATVTTVYTYTTNPTALALDGSSSLYVADASSAVRKLNVSIVPAINTTIAGNGTYGYSGDNTLATTAELENPWGVAVDLSHNIYIADRTARVVRRVDPTGIITTFVGTGICANNGDGGPSYAANVCTPQGLAIDPTSRYLYIADLSYNVRRVDLTTGLISTFAGGGTSTADGVPATTALLTADAIGVDASGNLYIGDHNHENIRKVSATTGLISTVTGNGTYGDSGDGNQASQATITTPWAIVFSSAGNIYFSDNSAVRRIDISTGVITTVTGVTGTSMTIDSSNNLYMLATRVIDKVTGLN
jgi:sugar lactone lactonase YvrE